MGTVTLNHTHFGSLRNKINSFVHINSFTSFLRKVNLAGKKDRLKNKSYVMNFIRLITLCKLPIKIYLLLNKLSEMMTS